MDAKQFSKKSPGRVVRVTTTWGGDHAFIPDPLPPNWEFPAALWPLLSDVKQQIGILEGLGRNLPNPGILLRPISDREAIRSSRLEGTFASPKELVLFELQPRESKSEDDPANHQREVFNYRKALDHGTNSELPISLRLMRELHQILLTGVRGRDRAPGEFRRIQVGIGGGRFIPPPAEQVTPCLGLLESYIHTESTSFDPLVECFLAHYQFETIHPFIDGNGRVGRLLLAIMMQQNCKLSMPWLYLSEFFEQHRDEYMSCLFNISVKGSWTEWIEYCLRGTLWQTQETIRRCENLRAIREEYLKRITSGGGSARLVQIVEDIFISPFIRVVDLPERLGVSYPTAGTDLQRLVDAGILEELPNERPKLYYAPEVFRISYDTLDGD
ncbi:Adenosine monophosphate-protein transferase SoFic [Symmachiella dynata]|uniref:Adenosine monophosphate-protein transferase SoFic n=1 Tax=Symmachiella dynata TaxID=2527995 RepID=A0A517ZJ08_9PLAN|nr:Adenosine monophosphate-protein transferase SoFic [Symmachiella dynata]